LKSVTETLTNYMEQKPSREANVHPASKQILHLLWSPKLIFTVFIRAPDWSLYWPRWVQSTPSLFP